MSRADIAVYTGTFDPIHVNHIGLCRYLLQSCGVDRVHVCPNGDSPLKPFAVPLVHRARMAELALEQQSFGDRCVVEHHGVGGDWQARAALCRRLLVAGGSVILVLGQDSFEKSVTRSEQGNAGSGRMNVAKAAGIFAFVRDGFRILVFPRAGSGPVQIPEALSAHTKVALDYEDACMTSSSAIREELLRGQRPDALMPLVMEYAQSKGLYSPRGSQGRVILIIGLPGCGKTTLARALQERLPWHTARYLDQASSAREGGLPLLTDLRTGHWIVDGVASDDFGEFEREVAAIDAVVELRSSKALCTGRAGPDSGALVRRMNQYLKHASVQKEQLKSYRATGRPHVVADVQAEESPQVLAARVLELLGDGGFWAPRRPEA